MVNAPSPNSQSTLRNEARSMKEGPLDKQLPENSKENLDARLDHGIEETFPASDPVSVTITKGSALDNADRQAISSNEPHQQSEAEQDTAEDLLDQMAERLRDMADAVSGTAQEAYDHGKHYVSQVRERYPEAGRYYQDARRGLNQRMVGQAWLPIIMAGIAGYALAWMIHGQRGGQDRRVPDYARTRRSYVPQPARPRR